MSVGQIGSTVTGTGTGSVTVALPAGLVPGDMIVAIIGYVRTSGFADWDIQRDGFQISVLDSGDPRAWVGYRYVDGSEGSSMTFHTTAGGATTVLMVVTVMCFRGRGVVIYPANNVTNDVVTNTTIVCQDPFDTVVGGSISLAFCLAYNVTGTAATCSVSGTSWTAEAFVDLHDGVTPREVMLKVAKNIVQSGDPGTATTPDPTFTFTATQDKLRTAQFSITESGISNANPSHWSPYEPDQPTKFTAEQMTQLRENIFAVSIRPMGFQPAWGYTNSVTRSEASPGTAALPARKYWYRGSGTSKQWVKASCTYTSTDLTKFAMYYSGDNEATYVAMTDQDGNYVATLTYDGSHNLTAVTWGNTP